MLDSKNNDDVDKTVVAAEPAEMRAPKPSNELLAVMTPFCQSHAEQHGMEFEDVVNELAQWALTEAPKFNMTWEEFIREYAAQREAEEEASKRNQNNLKETMVPAAVPVAVAAAAAADPPLPLANTIEYEEEIPKLLFVDMQQQDVEKVAAALKKMAELLGTSNDNRKVNADQALSVGAIAIILLLMRKWHNIKSIQVYGCKVLASLTFLTWSTHFNGLTEENAAKDALAKATAAAVSLINSGGTETIMAAMKSFPDDGDIQGKGCHAIASAFYYDNPTVNRVERRNWRGRRGVIETLQYQVVVDYINPTVDEAMNRFVHKLNGIKLVVSMMKKFESNASVQKYGCHVLLLLSKKQALSDALKKGGALTAVSEATEKHDDNNLQSYATAFFKNMFGNNS